MDLRRRFSLLCQACGKAFESGGRTGRDAETRFCSRRCAADARWRTGSVARELSAIQGAYLAGVIDGEGSIILYRRGKGAALRLNVANTNLELVRWCVNTTGVGNIVRKKSENPRHKSSYLWLVNSQAAASVLKQILVYLVIKQRQAEIGIEFQNRLKVPSHKAEKEWQKQWRTVVQRLNRRGPVDDAAGCGTETLIPRLERNQVKLLGA